MSAMTPAQVIRAMESLDPNEPIIVMWWDKSLFYNDHATVAMDFDEVWSHALDTHFDEPERPSGDIYDAITVALDNAIEEME